MNTVELKDRYSRALCFRLFENNGIIKRDLVNQITKNLSRDERANLRRKGIKIGRYHIFLPKMLKPSAVTLRITLWKNFFQDSKLSVLPKFGLNFLKSESKKNKQFLLICGFENFETFYVRVDILERLFLKIIDCTKDGKFIPNSDMINLIGCTKENFIKLLKLMKYKLLYNSNTKEEYFVYKPEKIKKREKNVNTKYKKNNPFEKLSEVRFK